jgi:hypothetical protein
LEPELLDAGVAEVELESLLEEPQPAIAPAITIAATAA